MNVAAILKSKGREVVTTGPNTTLLDIAEQLREHRIGCIVVTGADGKVVGINTAIYGRTFQGISFAIPAKRARSAYEQIRKTGRVVLGYWGVRPDMPTRRQIDRLKLPYDRQLGPIINEVTPGSPAAEAGVEKNDIILQWNGQPAVDHLLLRIMIAQTPIGSKVPVKILRGGQEITLEATVIEQPTAGSRQ